MNVDEFKQKLEEYTNAGFIIVYTYKGGAVLMYNEVTGNKISIDTEGRVFHLEQYS
jgi:hypothetical protein